MLLTSARAFRLWNRNYPDVSTFKRVLPNEFPRGMLRRKGSVGLCSKNRVLCFRASTGNQGIMLKIMLRRRYNAQIGHFRVLLYLCFKTSPSAKPFIWKWVLHAVSFSCNQSHFHKNGFALRLALKQRHKGTRKWPAGFKWHFHPTPDN